MPPFGVPSSATAPASTIAVDPVASCALSGWSDPDWNDRRHRRIEQNSVEQLSVLVDAALAPAGFNASGVYYIRFQANAANTVVESAAPDSEQPIPVRFISVALPELRTTALSVPSVMQPGDTIAPTFQITNLGTASTDSQGPVQVALVASVTPDFNLGSSIVAIYTLPSAIAGSSDTPVRTVRFATT